jgi:hypothetical protein
MENKEREEIQLDRDTYGFLLEDEDNWWELKKGYC